MKKPPIPSFNTPIIEIFTNELRMYLPLNEGFDYSPVITDKQQAPIIERFKINAAKSKFCFVFNGLDETVKHVNGSSKCLGYDEKSFSMKTLLSVTHPAHSFAAWMNGAAIWYALIEKKELATFDDLQFVYTIALKHANGIYKYCSCEAFFFQLAKCGKGTEFGYEYTVLKDWAGEDFTYSINDKNGPRPDVIQLVSDKKKIKFRSVGFFADMEMKILKQFAYAKHKTAADIAQGVGIKSKHTVSKHNQNIFEKADKLFRIRFKDCLSFANHLKAHELI